MITNLLINHFIIAAMLLLDAFMDATKIKEGKTINHKLETAILFVIVPVLLLFNLSYSVPLFVAYVAHYFALRLLLFDRIINHFMGWDDDYLGETAETDKIMRELGAWGKVARIGVAMLTSFLVIGETAEVFLSESAQNVFAWIVFAMIFISGLGFYFKNWKQ